MEKNLNKDNELNLTFNIKLNELKKDEIELNKQLEKLEKLEIHEKSISNLKLLSVQDVYKPAVKFAKTFIETFKGHSITEEEVLTQILKANFISADFNDNSTGKFFYELNLICLNNDSDLSEPSQELYHEILHYIQSIYSNNDILLKMGLFTPKKFLKKEKGLGINEAAVQYITSQLFNKEKTRVKYYGLEFETLSEEAYAIETSLLEQMIYFTGEFALVNSALFSNNLFEETFSKVTDNNSFKTISKNFDKIISKQEDISNIYTELATTEMTTEEKVDILNEIKQKKDEFRNLILTTQELIYTNAFENILAKVDSFDDILSLQKSLNTFSNLLLTKDDNLQYEEFKNNIMFKLKEKFDLIENTENYEFAGKLEKDPYALPVASNLSFIQKLFTKIKLLIEIRLGKFANDFNMHN